MTLGGTPVFPKKCYYPKKETAPCTKQQILCTEAFVPPNFDKWVIGVAVLVSATAVVLGCLIATTCKLNNHLYRIKISFWKEGLIVNIS